MNKDKIIKDLKERNDKLKMQYEYKDIRVHHLEYVNKKQQEVLDKIEEILKKRKYYVNIDGMFYEYDVKDILELLEEVNE